MRSGVHFEAPRAQQENLADLQTTQKVFASFKEYEDALNNNDAAAIDIFAEMKGIKYGPLATSTHEMKNEPETVPVEPVRDALLDFGD